MLRATWDERLYCYVERLEYDFGQKEGTIHFPVDNCCDMRACISIFTAIDPKVERITTYAGGLRDVIYELEEGTWTVWQTAYQLTDKGRQELAERDKRTK